MREFCPTKILNLGDPSFVWSNLAEHKNAFCTELAPPSLTLHKLTVYVFAASMDRMKCYSNQLYFQYGHVWQTWKKCEPTVNPVNLPLTLKLPMGCYCSCTFNSMHTLVYMGVHVYLFIIPECIKVLLIAMGILCFDHLFFSMVYS